MKLFNFKGFRKTNPQAPPPAPLTRVNQPGTGSDQLYRRNILNDQLSNPNQDRQALDQKFVSDRDSYGNKFIASSWVKSVNQVGSSVVVVTRSGRTYDTDVGSPGEQEIRQATISQSPSVGKQVNQFWKAYG